MPKELLNKTPRSWPGVGGAPRWTDGVPRMPGRNVGEGQQSGRRPEFPVDEFHGQQWKVLVGKGHWSQFIFLRELSCLPW